MRHTPAGLLALLLTFGCASEVTGPSPTITGSPGAEDPAAAPTSPGFACGEQLDTWVELRGTDFSPLLVDVIDADKDPSLLLPTVTLTLVSTVEGDPTDDVAIKTLEASAGDTEIQWISAELVRFRVHPELELPPGVYDVTLTNANGNAVTSPGAFGVAPRPVAAVVLDDLACVAQAARTLRVQGDHFLVRGAELPSVAIGPNTYAPDSAQDCRALAPAFGAYQLCRELTVTVPAADLDPGAATVTVTNIDPAGCASTEPLTLTIVPPPSVAAITPQPICSEQLDYDMVQVTGDGFIKVIDAGGAEALPTIQVGEQTYPAAAIDGCAAIDSVVNQGAESCTGLTFMIPAGDQPPGLPEVTVENPQPAGCVSEEMVTLTVVPPPTIEQVEPQLICTAQGENTLTVTGTGFLDVDGAQPTVTFGEQSYPVAAMDGCEPVEAPTTVQSCTSVAVTVPEGDLADTGSYDVTLTNPDPAGCTSTDEVALVVAPPPTLSGVEPTYTCTETGAMAVTLSGTGFLSIDDALPTVSIGDQEVPADSLGGCDPIPDAPQAMTCTELVVTVPEGLGEMSWPLTVTNPAAASCSSVEEVSLQTFPAPAVTGAAPGLFCLSDGEAAMTVTGTDFFTVGDALPSLLFADEAYLASEATGCEPVEGFEGLERCSGLIATIPQGAADTAVYAVGVQNPAPVGCVSAEPDTPVEVIVAGGPTIEGTEPMAICRGQFDGALTVQGQGFFSIDGAAPSVTINDAPATVGDLSGCEPVAGVDGVEACTALALTVPEALRDEDLLIELTNPAPADCDPSMLEMIVQEPPRIDDVQPQKICTTGGALVLTGDFFEEGMTVTLGGVAAEEVEITSPQMATARWAGPLDPGLAELTATNPTGCVTTFETEIRVTDGPVVFFVDPPITYNELSIQVTIFLGNLFGGSVSRVVITDEAGEELDLEFTFNPDTDNRVQAIVPAGLDPGSYDVTLYDEISCQGTTDDLLRVTDEATVALAEVFPPFGWTSSDTAVVLSTTDPLPDGAANFEPTPRVYINPTMPEADDLAVELRAVTLVNDAEMNGVISAGLPVGLYDIISVNPSGTVGVLREAFTVTEAPPPLIDAVSPGSWETGLDALAVTVEGQNFLNPTVTAECRDSGGAPLNDPPISVTGGDGEVINLSVNTAATLQHLSVCVIQVTNEDSSFDAFGPITVTNPAGNFVAFRPGTDFNVARRAPAVTAGVPARTSRFMYIIGGDDGAAAMAMDSVEFTTVDRFGETGDWLPHPLDLPAPRTLTRAARIDDFVYLAGGHDGTAAVDTIWRAQVLDPAAVPRIDGLDFEFVDEGDGLGQGVYTYRVSAVLDGTDAANPDGESLPSEPQPVFVPDLPQAVHLVLEWTAIPNAAGYRVYRSPMADQTFGQEELIAELGADARRFIDDGTLTTVSERPLPIGTLGTWHPVGTLATARFNHGVTVAPDPNDAAVRHIYVAGGEGTPGTPLDSIERVTVQINGPADQTVTHAPNVATLTTSRTRLELLTASSFNANQLASDEVVLYALPGDEGGSIGRAVQKADVLPGGGLSAFAATSDMSRSTGYASAAANNALVSVGGGSNTAGTGGRSVQLINNAGDLDNWNSLGNTNVRARYLMGRVVFSGFFYLVGGQTDADNASNTIDLSILGGVP